MFYSIRSKRYERAVKNLNLLVANQGREICFNVDTFAKGNVLKIVLAVIGLVYIPVTTSVFNTFSCTKKDCDAGILSFLWYEVNHFPRNIVCGANLLPR